MASKSTIGRQIAWLFLIPYFLFTGAWVLIFSFFGLPFDSVLMYALFVYLVTALVLRFSIPRNHRNGILLVKVGNYQTAANEFRKSYEFFLKHAWVDKYRYITMLSANRISSTEMALLNMAFCYTQCDNGALAKQWYEKALELFPDSAMAKAYLNMAHAFSDQSRKSE